MKKMLKIVGCVVAAVVGIVLLLLLTLPLWLGPVVQPTAGTLLPKLTGTTVRLGHLSLNPYTGRFELGDFVVGNPAGYDEPVAVAISNVVVDVAVATLPDKYVHIEEVVVEDLFLSYVKGGENGVENVLQIQYNIAGGKEKYEANAAKSEQAKAEAKAKADALAQEAEAREQARLSKMTDEERDAYLARLEAEAAAEAAGEKCFSIDHLVIRNIRIKYGLLTLPLPSLELHNLGKDGKGLTAAELYEAIWEAILKAAMAAGDGIKKLGEAAGNMGKDAGKAVEAVGEGAGKAVEAVKGLLNF